MEWEPSLELVGWNCVSGKNTQMFQIVQLSLDEAALSAT